VAAVVLPVVVGVVLSNTVVWRASYSLYSVTKTNVGNTFATRTVDLSNDGTSPLFSMTGIVLGQTDNRCIKISSDTVLPTTVKLYTAIGTAPANDISQYVNIKIEKGTGGTFASCGSFSPATTPFNAALNTLTATYTNFGNGLGPWSLTGASLPETLSYRITWTFSASAPGTTQSGSVPSVTFTWEARTS
jgi:hypothetical protein